MLIFKLFAQSKDLTNSPVLNELTFKTGHILFSVFMGAIRNLIHNFVADVGCIPMHLILFTNLVVMAGL